MTESQEIISLLREVDKNLSGGIGGGGTLDETITTNILCGGIAEGTTLEKGTKVVDIIKDMVFTYIKPSVSLTRSNASGKLSYESGESTGTVKLKFKATDSTSAKVVSINIYKGATLIHTKTNAVSGTYYEYEDTDGCSSNTTYYAKVVDDIKGENASTSISVGFYYRYFTGAFDSIAELGKTRATLTLGNLITSNAITIDSSLQKPVMAFAVPVAFSMTSAITASNYNMMQNLVMHGSNNYESVDIKNANDVDIAYKLYVFSNATAVQSLTPVKFSK